MNSDAFFEQRQNRLHLRQLLVLVRQNADGIAEHLLHELLFLVRVVVGFGGDDRVGLALLFAKAETNHGRHILLHDRLQHFVAAGLAGGAALNVGAATTQPLVHVGLLVGGWRLFQHHHCLVEIVFSKHALLF